jgi:hypothetical protein
MKRFLGESVRILTLLLLTLAGLFYTLIGGNGLLAALSGGQLWLQTGWFALLLALGLLLLAGCWRLWRGNGSGVPVAMRSLFGVLLLAVGDWGWGFWQGVSLTGMWPFLLPGLLGLLVLLLVRFSSLNQIVAFDRIAVSTQTLDRLDEIL